jgi:hypothetical protein
MSDPGPTERAARAFVVSLGELSGAQATLAEACYLVASALDLRSGGPDMATAANLRELRATLASLESRGDSDSGDAFVASLLAPVEYAADGQADAGRGGGEVRGGVGNAADAVAAARRRRGARGGS